MPKRRRFSRRGFRHRKRRRFSRRFRRPRIGHRRRRLPNFGVPQSKLVKLKYIDVDSPAFTAGATSFVISNSYRLNGAFDVNSAIASTAMPGFIEWSTFYRFYRVMSAKVTMTVSSQIASAQYMFMWMTPTYATNALPVTFSASWPDTKQLEAQRNCKVKLLNSESSANSMKTISMYRTMKHLQADMTAVADSSWVGLTGPTGTGSNPASLIMCYTGVFTGTATPYSNGVIVGVAKTTVTMWVKFYEPFGVTT